MTVTLRPWPELQEGLPPLSTDDRRRLAESLAEHGLRHPIIALPDGRIVDGHHRWEILNGNTPADMIHVVDLPVAVARDFGITINDARRNMSPEQRAEVRKAQQRQREYVLSQLETKTQQQVAAETGVPQQTISDWAAAALPDSGKASPRRDHRLKVSKDGRLDVIKRVEAGESTATVAADHSITPRRVRQVVKKHRDQEAKRAKKAAATAEGSATIVHADAVAWLETIEDGTADLLLTDPPYSTDVEDVAAFAKSWAPLALSKVKPTGRAYICIGSYPIELAAYLAIPSDLALVDVLVWTYRNTLGPKAGRTYLRNWQAILHYIGDDAGNLDAGKMTDQFAVIDIAAPDGRHDGRLHPWEKPDKLAERLISHATSPGDLIIDPFAGTGTFIATAARTGRVARGCDRDPAMVKHCESRGCKRV